MHKFQGTFSLNTLHLRVHENYVVLLYLFEYDLDLLYKNEELQKAHQSTHYTQRKLGIQTQVIQVSRITNSGFKEAPCFVHTQFKVNQIEK